MARSPEKIDVAVIGVGRMGHHHARTYKSLPQANLVAVVDADEERAATVADEFGCDLCLSPQQLLERYESTLRAASIAVPTVAHMPAARPLLERSIACLIEKPLAATPDEARTLCDLAAKHNTTVQVGHTERFNPAVRAVAAMNLTPRFIEVHRVSPMTFRSMDVGVVMDVMIHDIDIVLTFVKSPLKRVEAAGVGVIGEPEDVCNARLVFENGCVVNITASRLALKTERRMRLISEDGYVSLDYQGRGGFVIRKDNNADLLRIVRQKLESGADLSSIDYSNLIRVDELKMDLPAGEEDPLTAELTAFLDAATRKSPPVVDVRAGHAAVEVAHMIIDAMKEHRWEGLDHTTL